MQMLRMIASAAVITFVFLPAVSFSQAMENTSERHTHQESAAMTKGPAPVEAETPPLPEGMSLEQVLDYSAGPPPENFPVTVPDDRIYSFVLFEQLEYRSDVLEDGHPSHLGWEAQGWIGKDYNKFWWKSEGERIFSGPNEGESENDILYSRLISSFWNFQSGIRYANEWNRDDYEDLWSGVIAIQGMAPYKFEVDCSLYISEKGDFTLEFEAEYDLRITQRLVLQPLLEIGVSAQDIDEKGIGAGITDCILDLRLRYEIKREFTPYAGIRYQSLMGETANIAEASGEDTDQVYLMAGLRFAF